MIRLHEFEIGSTFELDHIIYKVCSADSCQGCSFYIEAENHCLDHSGCCGYCSSNYRLDGQDVIFVQVGESDV